jgi:hypothetical protein
MIIGAVLVVYMRLLTCFLVVALAAMFDAAWAVEHADASVQKQLFGLETRYFGHGFESDSDQRRTERLESLIFGEPAPGDLNQRIAAMVEIAAKSAPPQENPRADADANQMPLPSQPYGGNWEQRETRSSKHDYFSENNVVPVAPQRSGGNSVSMVQPLPATTTDYPRVTALEKAILGHTFVGRPLIERISRMERKAFGEASSESDLGQRTDALERYAEQKLHKTISTDDQSTRPGNSKTQDVQQVANMLGRTLLGLAGFPTAGVGSATSGAPGFGPNLGPGFHNRAVRQAPPPKPEEPTDADKDKDDPILLSSTPPPPQAKLLTKIGWCEMRVFGQTYREMHLFERLGQLNQQLNFSPGRSGAALMDHVNDLMKAAMAAKPITRPLSTASSSEDE